MFGKRYNNCVKKTKKEELEVETPSLNEKVAQEFAHTAGLVKRSDKTVTYKPYTYAALQRFYATSTGAGSIYEKKMTKKQMKKRDEIADAISTKDMKKRYGDKNVKYAIATKLAMKEENIDEGVLSTIAGLGYLAKKALMSKAALKVGGGLAMGLGSGLGRSLPYIVAPKTMTQIAALRAAGSGLSLASNLARKSAAEKEKEK